MTDITERLRRYAGGMCISTPTEIEAADIIEGLRAEVKDRNEVIAMLQNELRAYKEREKTMGWNND